MMYVLDSKAMIFNFEVEDSIGNGFNIESDTNRSLYSILNFYIQVDVHGPADRSSWLIKYQAQLEIRFWSANVDIEA